MPQEGTIGQDGGRKGVLTSSRAGFAGGTLEMRTFQEEKFVQRPGGIQQPVFRELRQESW